MKQMRFADRFDHVTSICVYERIPMFDRVEINRNIRDLLEDGGRFETRRANDYTSGALFLEKGTP